MAAVAAGDDGFPGKRSDWPVLDGTDRHSDFSRIPSAVRSPRTVLCMALLLLEWVAFLLEREHQRVRLLEMEVGKRRVVELLRLANGCTDHSILHQAQRVEGTLLAAEEDKVLPRRQGTGHLHAIRTLVRCC